MHAPDVTHWRTSLQAGRRQLRENFDRDNRTSKLLRGHCRLVDALLRDVWIQAGLPPEFALIAVGGYGRGELFPQSDVDILILLPNTSSATQHALESLVGLLWDIGLAIGHSVRTLQECLDEADRDITIQTNLLEARRLAGSRSLYHAFTSAVREHLNPEAFFLAKLREQSQRHRRFNDTSYNLEPNIKESPGGLRDLHMIAWAAQALGYAPAWQRLCKAGILNPSEARQIRHHAKLLNNLRVRLHYLANRREDRLLFDHQDTLARQMIPAQKLEKKQRKRPSEQLMQQFYQSARTIRLMNDILLGVFKDILAERLQQTQILPIDAFFQVKNKLLDIKQADLFETHPECILTAFHLIQQDKRLQGMSPTTMRSLWLARNQVNRSFRSSKPHQRAFVGLLKSPEFQISTLRRMHRYGILGKYIPAFGRITHQMQHDLFHVYTVDEHTLNVLGNMAGFANPERRHEFPLCSKLFSTFDKPELLYLAALFHDIAKGRGGDHSVLGEADARRFCRRHGLENGDTVLVAWLVRNHLILSATAQQQDTSDPEVIAEFAKSVGDARHLTALYLLTVADVRGTSPAIWNAWKSRLFESLYQRTLNYLQTPVGNLNAEIQGRQQEVMVILGHYGISSKMVAPVWENLEDNYFLRHETKEIAWQTRLLLTHVNTTKPIVRARLSPAGDGIQIMIYTPDRDDLFARICGFFERIDHSIVEAKINTTRHGYALDSFLVLDRNDRSVRYGDLIAYIEAHLTAKLADNAPVQPPLQGRSSRQLKHFPIESHASVRPASDKNHNQYLLTLVTGDRPGLLSRLAHFFVHHGIRLQNAKINTLGARAEDSFVITPINGKSLNAAEMTQLEASLLEVIGSQ